MNTLLQLARLNLMPEQSHFPLSICQVPLLLQLPLLLLLLLLLLLH
jgi:hypothetical protein